MVEAGEPAAAELAYQRALRALHEARADLSEVAAARRRFGFDRSRLSPEDVVARSTDLAAAHDRLTLRVDELREQAAALRVVLRRLTDEVGSEPDDVPEEPDTDGFRQPPFGSSP